MTRDIGINIDVIVHATESLEKIYGSFEDMFGIRRDKFEVRHTTGHFDNQIILLSANIVMDAASKVVTRLASDIATHEKEAILESINDDADDGIYVRLDKQDFVLGKISLGQQNAIKFRIYARQYRKKSLGQMCQELLGMEG